MSDELHPTTRDEASRPAAPTGDSRHGQWSEWSRTLSVAVLTAVVTLTSSWLASENALRQVELQTRTEREAAIRAERRDAYSRLLADLNAFRPTVEGCWDLQFPPTDWDPANDAYPTLQTAFQDLGAVQLIGTPHATSVATEAYYDAEFLADECDRVRLSVAEDPTLGGVDGPLAENWDAIMIAFELQATSAALTLETFRADLLGTSDDRTVAQLTADVDEMRAQLDDIYPGGEIPGD
ncbi:hypothetical protein [Cellulomonas fimi]|uniref:Uncharacterized protein n=1 Tax=Cellulomonas fimi (strain ATCC 484 / DSM 20113 / JCM 1341 / CCUG 24087 / LMG 16345 / NBRC 15513 / NCIMB 8980 / NCTC 7547 / NRS-133) TaxID=590998 RepID=F4H816_CELFA|nr:hypothetical protein [Cellulomonas fimi]AEE46977.1 hypothetical protein Celf_2855 [Cellulomonas fimi ATCC 484]NNH07510.1 hypothetical protein [Cellulomonas fimi]VEH34744.1 Uncharacterised protein [Cellulomonas fimi]